MQGRRRSDYNPVQFSGEQSSAPTNVFPTGVCDWSKSGVSQAPTMSWLTYDCQVGGKRLGPAPRSTPPG